ncbi:MAG: ferritin [Clostridia bacterium]|nr:ferritin [Clostridia bacterium]MBT7121652.1 ferritin [Clostridia bacterium]
MMNKKLLGEINKQIGLEFYSQHFYLSMAAYSAANDLPGFESWFLAQGQEEDFHAMRFYRYLNQRDEKVVITGFEDPPTEFSSVLDAFEKGLAHEKTVTDRINYLMSIAHEEKDYAAVNFLNWYVDEQVEEEDTFSTMIGKVKMVGDGMGLYELDKEAAARTFVPPAAE